MILIATIGGLLTLLFWGLSDYFAGKSGQKVDAYLTTLIVQLMGTIFLLPVVLWYGLSISISASLIVVVVISLLFTIAYIFFIKSLASGPFGVAAPIANSYAFITLLLGFLFLQFQLTYFLPFRCLNMILFHFHHIKYQFFYPLHFHIILLFKNCCIKKFSISSKIFPFNETISEAFSSCLLKFSPKLESYTATLSTSSFMTALIVSFCGRLRA